MDLCVDFPLDHRTLVDRDTNNLCRDPRIVTWQNKSKVSHWLTPWIAILSSWVAIHFFMDLPVLVIAETSALCIGITHPRQPSKIFLTKTQQAVHAGSRPCAREAVCAHAQQALRVPSRPCARAGGHVFAREAMRARGRPCACPASRART